MTARSLIERAAEAYGRGFRGAQPRQIEDRPIAITPAEVSRADPNDRSAEANAFSITAPSLAGDVPLAAATPADIGASERPPSAVVTRLPRARRPGQPEMLIVDRERLRDRGFIVPGDAPSRLAEEFRLVKRRLLLAAARGPDGAPIAHGNMILMCSAHAGDGKTFCAVNLALSLAAERDTEVLLVDADVAKPDVAPMLGVTGGPGLMDALADPTLDVERLIVPTDIDRLSILPAGGMRRDDTELLASARTRDVLKALGEARPGRVVIFDSAPALAASPASVLALHVGQVVMVVRADRTAEAELRDALSLVDGCANVSLLLNGTSFAGGPRKFGSYYGRRDLPQAEAPPSAHTGKAA